MLLVLLWCQGEKLVEALLRLYQTHCLVMNLTSFLVSNMTLIYKILLLFCCCELLITHYPK
jgi:hypothetical protein